jgi:amidohydrolase
MRSCLPSSHNPPAAVPAASVLEPITDEALAALLSRIRRHLHHRPEVAFEVYESAAFLRGLLADHGLEAVGPFAGAGFYVEIVGANPGPTIAYRTELDALPAPDGKTVEYASSVPNAAHLCGHDAHMAIAVGVALLLNQRRDHLHGTVRVFFQPNEEGIPTGAPIMIADGILEGIEEIYCVHSDPSLDVGMVGLRAGPITAGTASWMVRVISGQAGHSARPHETIDTVWVANQILQAFYQLAGRVHDARRTAVLTACTFHGGQALNVIPNEVEFGGTLRCIDPDSMALLSRRMEDVVEQFGALYGADVRYDADLGLPPVINDVGVIEAVHVAVTDLLGPDAVYHIPEPSMGGEDFAFYLKHVPGALVRIGTRGGPETSYPLHHTLFDIDERALPIAAQLMAEVLARRLTRIL